MFYKPKTGSIWDPSVIYFKGKYYMLCMYLRPGSNRQDAMWLAESEDGVHWKDHGSVLIAEHDVYKMFPYICGDKCLINYGSSRTVPGSDNDTLYYCESSDMLHWTQFREDHPDERWYNPAGRWDHMYVAPKDEGEGYWGYVVATPKPQLHSAWGMMESQNGYEWTILPPPIIEWGRLPEISVLEGGGCEKIGDEYYYIGGVGGYARNCGYGLYTFRSQSPTGPFHPDEEAFRLCGFDRLPGHIFLQNLAAFCRGENDELLISNAFDAGGYGNIWLLPMRKAVTDAAGHLRLGYWSQNDRAKGEQLPMQRQYSVLISERDGRPEGAPCGQFDIPDESSLFLASDSGHPCFALTDSYALAVQQKSYDLEQGIVVEGCFTADICPNGVGSIAWPDCWRNSSVGFYIEYEGAVVGMAFMLELGHPYHRVSSVENLRKKELKLQSELLDVTGEGCATVQGADKDIPHSFRLFLRGIMAELYVDDLLVQSFPLLEKTSGRIGFVTRNAECRWEQLCIRALNLE